MLGNVYKNILSIVPIRKSWNQPKSLSTVEYIRELCYMDHEVVKMNE